VPSFTSAGTNLQGAGPIIDVQIALSKEAAIELRSTGHPVPAPYFAVAMIDTGASLTVIREELARDLGLQPTGTTTINTPSDTNVRCYKYAIQLLLPNDISFETPVLAVPLKGQHIDCLIGRDVLARGILVYIGPDNLFTLSF
jgi:predicted aspartyl protease